MTLELPMISIILTIIGLILNYYIFSAKSKRDSSETERRMGERIVMLETKMEVFWSCIENNIGSILRSPNHQERDLLMEKLAHKTISNEELHRLSVVLKENIADDESNKASLCLALSTVETRIKTNR